MKILSVEASNFGSYRKLDFNFDNLGLALVSGSTGAGKSTLLDVVAWSLYGVTAKNGSVEDVRSWKTDGGATLGVCEVALSDTVIRITRVRGSAASNDLYWTEPSGEVRRGKDLGDTQKLLEARLGVTVDQFLASCYLHQFSTVGSFFAANAKSRRGMLEGLTDLHLPITISNRASEARKCAKATLSGRMDETNQAKGRLTQLGDSLSATKASAEKWRKDQKAKIKDLKAKAATFEDDKASRIALAASNHADWDAAQVKSLSSLNQSVKRLKGIVKDPKHFDLEESEIRNSLRCTECGSLPGNVNEALLECKLKKADNTKNRLELKRVSDELTKLSKLKNPYAYAVRDAESEINHFESMFEEAEGDANPFDQVLIEILQQLGEAATGLQSLEAEVKTLQESIGALDRLYDLSFVLRAELLKKVVKQLEDQTNGYIERYFDAEIKVVFSAEDADNISVNIRKSGYECNFKQLSRGQMSLLKIAFGVSVMKATANHAGQRFNLLMLDEVLDGCDTNLKVKAVALFEELSTQHDTVLVIDHATEVKNSFAKTYLVELVGDESVINEQ